MLTFAQNLKCICLNLCSQLKTTLWTISWLPHNHWSRLTTDSTKPVEDVPHLQEILEIEVLSLRRRHDWILQNGVDVNNVSPVGNRPCQDLPPTRTYFITCSKSTNDSNTRGCLTQLKGDLFLAKITLKFCFCIKLK